MINTLKTLRQAGFFKYYESLTDIDLIDIIRNRIKDHYSKLLGYNYKPKDFLSLNEILLEDNKKFLDIDLEADVCNGNNVYVSVLEAFAEASNGYFNPSDIREAWKSDKGPIKVSFLSDGQQIIFEPEYLDDWIDERVFEVIHQEMRKVCSEKFMLCFGPNDEWLGQNVIYIRLTQDEMQLLKEELNWNFSSY